MHTLKTTTIVSAAFISLLLSACGGSGSPMGPKNGTSSSSVSSGIVDTTSPQKIGYGSGSNFVDGAIGVGIGNTTLSAGASTALTINVVSSTNTLVTNALEITFNSDCVAANKAKLTNLAGDPVTRLPINNGQATITYIASGCKGTDLVTATTSIDGKVVSAKVTLTIEADTVGSIKFIEADPILIGLAGTGLQETSIVKFQVLGSTNAPIADELVNFGIDVSPGGLRLTNTSGKTDSNGYVTTTVNSGTVATPVRVTATAVSKVISTQSSELLVSTGIPDQDSMSLSASVVNPSGWGHDGEEVDITIRMADAFNNLAPDGTAVAFTTEGGAIDPGCTTTRGTCTVKWTSTNPRPNNGRVTILATAIGNESFVDVDGNGYYDYGVDTFRTYDDGGNCDVNSPRPSSAKPLLSTACDDLVEAYRDDNENGVFDGTGINGEVPFDISRIDPADETKLLPPNGKHDTEDGIYNGILCKIPDSAPAGSRKGIGCTKTSVTVRDDLVLVMSSDDPKASDLPKAPGDTTVQLTGQPAKMVLTPGLSIPFTVTLQDIHGNSMPFGTTITLNTASASDVTISHNMPSTGVANTTETKDFIVTVKASDTKAPSGSFSIEVNAPYKTTSFTTNFQ